jgi:hypothetical protein
MTPTTLNPLLRAEDLFDSLKPEEKQPEEKRIEVRRNKRLEKIIRGFENSIKKFPVSRLESYNSSEDISKLMKRLTPYKPTSHEISDFSILLENYQDFNRFEKYAGFYLSSLINKSRDKEFIICTRHLEKLPDYVGYKNNGKIIRVNGDAGHHIGKSMNRGKIYATNVGYFVGCYMQGGEIHIKNAGPCLGFKMCDGIIYAEDAEDSVGDHMQGGTIHVKNTKNYLGDNMQAGKIYVENAGEIIGAFMQGGTIYIGNSYKSLTDNIQGNIYFQGKLIVKDGVKLI